MTDARVLLIPGFNGSGPDHWQTLWEARRDDCRRVEQDDWHDPRPAIWAARIDAAVREADGPLVVVAHSLGCAALAHWASETPDAGQLVAAALVVAPCDVERPGAPECIARFAPMPGSALPFRTTVVASSNDPFATAARARCFSERWGAALVEVGAQGHINAASGLDDWRFGQVLLDELIAGAGRVGDYAKVAAMRDAAPWPCGG